jgi:hypothetical protein
MIEALVEPRAWPKRRLWLTVAFLMLLQVGLIFWLRERPAVHPPVPIAGLQLLLPSEQAVAWPWLSNPTLFALPNQAGFSGAAWMNFPQLEYHFPEWTNAPRLLAQPVARLGETFKEYSHTNAAGGFEVVKRMQPDFNELGDYSFLELAPTQSTVRVTGDLANRPLLSAFKLDSWPASEILANTEVQISVAQDGRVFSAVLLTHASPNADAFALNLAKTARFQPAKAKESFLSAANLSWGKLVFQWHTIPLAATNSTAGGT